MKRLFIIFFVLIAVHTHAQNTYNGEWYGNKDGDAGVFAVLSIKDKKSIFEVVNNQLGLACKNAYLKDTLLLYVISSDQGRGFMGPKYYPPDPKSLFAKCFLTGKELHIIYTQKMFSNHIKDLGLYTVLYKR